MTNKPKEIATKISSKGQIVIPISIRRELNLQEGDQLIIKVNDQHGLTLKKLPTALDWNNLVEQIPHEKVDLDENGHYDPQKSPKFHQWMTEE